MKNTSVSEWLRNIMKSVKKILTNHSTKKTVISISISMSPTKNKVSLPIPFQNNIMHLQVPL